LPTRFNWRSGQALSGNSRRAGKFLTPAGEIAYKYKGHSSAFYQNLRPIPGISQKSAQHFCSNGYVKGRPDKITQVVKQLLIGMRITPHRVLISGCPPEIA
jgi:hypothetical protein